MYKILHLYGDYLDLYGDSFNVTILKACIERMGYDCTVTAAGTGDNENPADYTITYIGHGKSRNLEAISTHFLSQGDAFIKSANDGSVLLFTGSSRLLLGRSFDGSGGNIYKGIGLFDYTGHETNTVITGDCICTPLFADETVRTYGFINRTAHIVGENKHPLFRVISGLSDGRDKTGFEGTLYNNLFATWQAGPLLAKNPCILKELLRRALGEAYRDFDTTLEEKALELILKGN